ncbi:hypothetical protein MASR2M66_20430 [Chloroflexota bacterium]
MTGIFVSYSRKDAIIANKIIKVFESIDLDVWVDWEDIPPASGWLDQIFQGIEQADAFIFLISPDSITSEVCKVELLHAQKNAKRIIPIVIRQVDPKSIELFIRDLNWIFIQDVDDFNDWTEKIKVAINLDVDWLREHRLLQVRALDWDRKKDSSLLLRGSDLRNAVHLMAAKEEKDPRPSDLQKLYISFSRRNERFRRVQLISAVVIGLIMIFLSIVAINQRQAAVAFAGEAQRQTALARKSETLAVNNARAAMIARASAEKNALIAQAQRSVARAQIFQSHAGGLFTSTLFAIDSYQRYPSVEAEETLRGNISLLPIPIKTIRQRGAILHVDVSPDGLTFVAANAEGVACLTRFEDGETLYCVTSSGSVLDATFSPDGKILVISSSSGEVKVFDAATGNLLKQMDFGVAVNDVNISPNSSLLAMARDDRRITLVKLSNYESAGEFSVNGNLRVTAFSPNGSLFAAGSGAGSITLWDLNTGKIISRVIHHGEVLDLAFSPDSRALVSGGTDNYAVVINTSTGNEKLRVLNEEWVTDVDVSPDGKWFVTASNDFRIRVWSFKSDKDQLRFLQESLVNEVKISPNGMWIASTGSDKTVRVLSAASGTEMFQIPLDSPGNALEFSKDGRYIVIGEANGNVTVWDISALEMNTGFLRFDEFINTIAVSPVGDKFAAATNGKVWLLKPDQFATLTEPSGTPALDFGEDVVSELDFDPAGTRLAISMKSGKVFLYNLASGKLQNISGGGAGQVLAFSLDGTENLILANQNGLLQYRSLSTGDGDVLWEESASIYSLTASPTGLLALGMEDKVVLVSPDGSVETLDSPGRNQFVSFDPAGILLAVSTPSGQTSIWQLREGHFFQTFGLSNRPIFSQGFTRDGKRLLLGNTDQILVIDPLAETQVNRIRQKGDVIDLAFAPDGTTLFSASLRTAQRFDLTAAREVLSDGLVSAACSRLTRNFSAAEWTLFFGEEEYRPMCEDLPVP